jgi:hypothetical protein
MNRRQFLLNAATTASLAHAAAATDTPVKRVLVMFKCHLDVGFVDTQAAIIKKYFDVYFPQAIQLAASLRQSGDERYVWTTGSWLIYQYLEQAGPEDRKRMEQALTTGDIAWHALPFTWQSELLDRTAMLGCIGFSKSLDRRFGRKTTGAKMTDVPGHSRGLISPLAASGIKLLDIGVNSASTPPEVPDAFVWKDPDGVSIIMLYHRKSYGGVIRIPRSDLAIAVEMRDDNSGPHTPEEIHQIYADLKAQFPAASIEAANLTDIANEVEPFRAALPVITQEIGDTWIHGVASDPAKLASIRELVRLRGEWVTQRKFQVADSTDLAFLSKFSLAVEHTWGTDTKTWLDFDHYTPDDLASKLSDPNYQTVTGSWVEKRHDIDDAVAGLPEALRGEATRRLAALKPIVPDTSGLKPYDAVAPLETTHFVIGIDPATGAINNLRQKSNQRSWASAQHPLAMVSYQTLSKADYDQFLASYITLQTDWAPKDFGKPNIEKFGAASRLWAPKITACWSNETAQGQRLLARLDFGTPESPQVTAWPEECYLDLWAPKAEAAIHVDFQWFSKRSNRLPEALWFTFRPAVFEAQGWTLSKIGQPVSPFDVVAGGNRHMHAVSSGVTYKDRRGSLEIETLDAPLVSLGEMSPIYFSKLQPDLSKGIHFNLFNNGWGTNYVQWFGEDMRFRFTLRAAKIGI